MRSITVALAATLLIGCSQGAADGDPMAGYTFSDQQTRTIADFDGRSVAVWGMCKP